MILNENIEKGFELNGFKHLEDGEIEAYYIEDFIKCSHPRCGKMPTKYREDCIDNVPVNLGFCDRHFFQMEVTRDKRNGYILEELNEDGIPIVYCRDDGIVHYYFFCKYCQEIHHHGRGYDGEGEGHRCAHCGDNFSPYEKTGYILKLDPEKSLENEKEYTDRYTTLNTKEIRKKLIEQIVQWDNEESEKEDELKKEMEN